MGQYHQIMNFDKKEILTASSFKKLTEWSYQDNELMLHFENLLKTTWKGDRILVVGDYVPEVYETSNLSALLKSIREENKDCNTENIYDYPYKVIKSSSFYSNRLPSRYIYNDLKKEYIDLKKQPLQWINYNEHLNYIDGYKLHPLSLVLACSNGRGGGDYYAKNMDKIGCWAESSQNIILSDELLDLDYKESDLIFNEFSEKESNIDIIVDFISENFSSKDIKKVEKLHFAPTFFLDEAEEKIIIDKSIENIKNKKINKTIENDLEEAMEK